MIKQSLILLGVLLIVNSTNIPRPYPWFPLQGKPLPKFSIEINDHPVDRWREIITLYKPHIQKFIDTFQAYTHVPNFVYKVAGVFGEQYYRNREYVEECRAISTLSEIEFGIIFTLNFLYDLTAFKECTSIIMRTSEGRIIHGRNWDFPFMRQFANLTLSLEVKRNGQLLFLADAIAGCVGFITAMKPGKFAVTVDTRHSGNELQNIIDLMTGFDLPAVWLLRKVLEQENTFQAAVRRLSYGRTASPIYFIVSGMKKNEGAVIQKERFGPHAVYRLNEDRWFLVQTNFDRNVDDPATDMRRLPAEGRILNLGNQINEQILLDNVLMKWPNLNIGTIYSITMCVETGYFNTTQWW